jgi:hypothetical protein
MTFRFKLQEPIAEGVRRISLEQIEIAQARLKVRGDVAGAVHDARRCLKRLRALLRLIRPALDKGTYKREIEELANTARLLAGTRDSHVMHHTLASLQDGSDPLPRTAVKRLQTLLEGDRGGGKRLAADDGRRTAIGRLQPTREFFADNGFNGIDFHDLADGMGVVYRKGRLRFRNACIRQAERRGLSCLAQERAIALAAHAPAFAWLAGCTRWPRQRGEGAVAAPG